MTSVFVRERDSEPYSMNLICSLRRHRRDKGEQQPLHTRPLQRLLIVASGKNYDLNISFTLTDLYHTRIKICFHKRNLFSETFFVNKGWPRQILKIWKLVSFIKYTMSKLRVWSLQSEQARQPFDNFSSTKISIRAFSRLVPKTLSLYN